MKGDTLVSVSYGGSHVKSTGCIDPPAHERMLGDCLAYYGSAYPLVVVATDCAAVQWDGVPVQSVAGNPGHQMGAAWCIRLALDYAAAHGYPYLFHLADDVAMSLSEIANAVAVLRDGWHYVGSNWANSGGCLNTQVFGCRVASYCNSFNPLAFGGGYMLEEYFHNLTRDLGLPGAIRSIGYHHTHSAEHHRLSMQQLRGNGYAPIQ